VTVTAREITAALRLEKERRFLLQTIKKKAQKLLTTSKKDRAGGRGRPVKTKTKV